ncbi:putative quinol monooxygenase [Nonomuraea longicatena]|uniref:Antibiotic biosynthesis monooxygenase n=1 Tax=Nonomuraea longicatena TaxID=83682 RepID=A0ABN1NVC1_9ACTN
MIIVAGRLRVAAPDRERFLALSGEAVRLARATPGCHDFAVSADPLDPERINVYERWADRAVLHAFRGDGPAGELDTLITGADIEEFEVTDE